MKRFLTILLALLLAVSLAGCSSAKLAANPQPAANEPEETPSGTETEEPADSAKSKIFTCEEMQITLTEDFSEEEGIEAYTGVFESSNSAVFVLREDKSLLSGIDMDRYLELVVEANKNAGHEVGDVHRKDGIPLFEYDFTNPSTNQTFSYYTTVFESDEAFWLVQFTCYASDYSDMVSTFHKYARSVAFTD